MPPYNQINWYFLHKAFAPQTLTEKSGKDLEALKNNQTLAVSSLSKMFNSSGRAYFRDNKNDFEPWSNSFSYRSENFASIGMMFHHKRFIR